MHKKILGLTLCLIAFCLLALVFDFFYPQTAERIGFIDTTGRLVIPPRYEIASPFIKGQAQGIVVDQSLIANLGFAFGTGLRSYTVHMIDKQGRDIVPPRSKTAELRSIQEFSDSSIIQDLNQSPFFRGSEETVSKDMLLTEDLSSGIQRYGFKDSSGKWILPPNYSSASAFEQGIAFVEVGGVTRLTTWGPPKGYTTESRGKWGLINQKGEFLFPPKCLYVWPFSEGIAMCKMKVYFGLFY